MSRAQLLHEGQRFGTTSARGGRALVVVLLALAAFVVGWGTRSWVVAPGSTEAVPGNAEQLYTCGMHPIVMQKGPGDCPICHMKLTPMKQDLGDEDGVEAGGPSQRKILYWRAPMDPNYVSEKPGKSPMGMDLVPVYADQSESSSGHSVRIDPVTIQNMGIRTQVLKRGPLVKTIRTVGRVDYDEQRVTFVNTKFEGWIEKLHVNETGRRIEKGQPLFDVYSPQLYSAQKEYLAAVRNLPIMEAKSTFKTARVEARRLVEAARIKLKYMDISDARIDELGESGEIKKSLTIFSPARGVVTDKHAEDGMYVKPGMPLYTIADLSRVWVYVDIYEYQLPWVRVGQEAAMSLSYVPGKEFSGQVVYVYPYLETKTRVIKVRLEFENLTQELKPGMFANVTLSAALDRDALLVPREAYIDSGTRKVLFVVRGGGRFEPRDIQVGVEAENGMVEVLYGLDEGEVVVTSGQFMLDAESKLLEAVAKMTEATRARTTRRTPDSQTSSAPDAGVPADAAYACPMDAHPDQTDPENQGAYFSPEPGRCPWCGMSLKAVGELDWIKVRKAAAGGDVAYTCPDHPHVFSDDSGQCPRCGSELAPFKAMYTCPDPAHAGVVGTISGNCPLCGQGLAPFRGVWLDESMADANVPSNTGIAELAPFRCPVHPLVHSDRAGACTICAKPLESGEPDDAEAVQIPPGSRFTCPMKECGVFSENEGTCPECGMKLKPIEDVAWARELTVPGPTFPLDAEFVCPMHPDSVRAAKPGTCTICGMQLVRGDTLALPRTAPARVAAQMDYITEHYLELVRLLAADQPDGTALHALGLASASETLAQYLREAGDEFGPDETEAVGALHKAALKMTGTNIQSDRVTLVALSAAVRTLIENIRPDRKRWPALRIYHCPMSKGDWIQASEEKANPYYGFKMLKCGVLRETR